MSVKAKLDQSTTTTLDEILEEFPLLNRNFTRDLFDVENPNSELKLRDEQMSWMKGRMGRDERIRKLSCDGGGYPMSEGSYCSLPSSLGEMLVVDGGKSENSSHIYHMFFDSMEEGEEVREREEECIDSEEEEEYKLVSLDFEPLEGEEGEWVLTRLKKKKKNCDDDQPSSSHIIEVHHYHHHPLPTNHQPPPPSMEMIVTNQLDVEKRSSSFSFNELLTKMRSIFKQNKRYSFPHSILLIFFTLLITSHLINYSQVIRE